MAPGRSRVISASGISARRHIEIACRNMVRFVGETRNVSSRLKEAKKTGDLKRHSEGRRVEGDESSGDH